MSSENELKHHIITEFARNYTSPAVLKEEHGYINNIDAVIEYFKTLVEPQVKLVFGDTPGNSVSKTYKNKININTFFEYYNLDITFEYSKTSSYKGGAAPKSVYVHPIKGEWVCVPDIELTIIASNGIKAMKNFSFAIGHELTHCYDLLQYAKETNQDPWYSIDRNRYFDIRTKHMYGIGNEKASANILYLLNRMERNAYIAQLKQELLNNKEQIKDSKSAFDAVKNTESYKKFLNLEYNMNVIMNLTDEETQQNLIKYLNDIMHKKFTTYNQLKKYYLNRWQKWKYKYLTTASKIVHDIYTQDNKNTWLDNGMFGKNDLTIKTK